MSLTIKKIALPELNPQSGSEPVLNANYLNLIATVEIECQIRLGSLTLTVAELKQLKQGQTLTLKQKITEPLDILVNNQVIARGELMCADDYFAIQITEIAL